MTEYILDSDIITYLGDQDSEFHANCMVRLMSLGPEDTLSVSILTMYEMAYSITVAPTEYLPELLQTRNELLEHYKILPLTTKGSILYGQMKARYKARLGAKTKAMKGFTADIILAAAALEYDAILVSNDNIFTRLQELQPDLKVENWALT